MFKTREAWLSGLFLGCLMLCSFPVVAEASGERTYWPGFKGSVSRFDMPSNTTRAEDRYLRLTIRLDAKPDAKQREFDSAFHAVCRHHQSDLLKTSKKLSSHIDWRVKVTFDWPSGQTNGLTVSVARNKYLFISNCRFE